jgi:hypothetical protein
MAGNISCHFTRTFGADSGVEPSTQFKQFEQLLRRGWEEKKK